MKVSTANQSVEHQETALKQTLCFKTKKFNALAPKLSEQAIEFASGKLGEEEDCKYGESVAIVQEILSILLTDVVNCNNENFIRTKEENISVASDKNTVIDPVELNWKISDFKEDPGSEKAEAEVGRNAEVGEEAPVGQIPTAFLLLRDPLATPESPSWNERIIFPMEHEVKGVSLWSVGIGGCVGVDYRFPTPTGREPVGKQVPSKGKFRFIGSKFKSGQRAIKSPIKDQMSSETYYGNPPILSFELLWEFTVLDIWIPSVARTELADSHSSSDDRIGGISLNIFSSVDSHSRSEDI